MSTINKEIEDFIRYVVEDGSNYRMDEMEKLYTADMAILFPSKDGSIVAISLTVSPIRGPAGNVEFLGLWRRGAEVVDDSAIARALEDSAALTAGSR